MSTEREVLEAAYRAFNARDIDAALATMHPDVAWPNGMEGGYVHGYRDVRDYRPRQWAIIDPRVGPLDFEVDGAGRILVNVHQVVRDLAGQIKADRVVQHVYQLRDQLIVSMEIRTPPPA
jgi:hypothetical protein